MDSSPPPDSTPPSPDPPSSSSSPPPPPSEDSTPPPSEDSTPPTPPSSSPPPASSSPPPSSPPPTTSSSPPPASSPPPTTPITSPSPPSPQNSDSSPPPSTPKTTSPPPPSNNDNKSPPSPSESSNYFSPPPPTHSSSSSSPPPLPSSKALSPPSPAQTHNAPPSNNEWTTDQMWAIGGIAAGAGLLLLVMLLLLCLCTRKKKKKSMPDHMQYYRDPSRTPKGGEHYTNDSKYTNYHNNHQPSDHIVKIPPPPGAAHGGWTSSPPPPPPPMMMSSIEEYSSSYTNSHTPPMQPPQQPSLGFNKSTFTYEELSAATGGFAQSNLLGQGGFGYVHKGVLPNGKEVAVKSLKSGSGQGEREFQAEVEIISRVHHRHLVSLVGYCIAGDQRMLVYEFLPNKTLEYHLHGKGRPAMDWSSRLKIAMGSAKGLAYLHEDCHPRIIHRDIKTANILLDFNMEAKVADFGLAKLSSDTYTHVSTRIMGTFGYLAPEYAASGKLTEKSDVFSYGVMILELITGKRPVDTTNAYMEDSLVDWARPIMARVLDDGNFVGLVDPHLENNYNAQEMTRMIACAAACIRHSARRRPKMSQIVRALEGDASLEDLNEVVKSSQSSNFSSSGSSEHQATSYNTNMKKFKRMELQSEAYESSEFGETSEYGLNPSSSSSDSSEELGSKTYGSRRQFT